MSTLHTLKPCVADAAELEPCEMCDGDGFQFETVWRGGWEDEPEEREVTCYLCAGRGHTVTLVCGRCGEHENAHPDELLHDERCCTTCGHVAPNYLWLPMRQEIGVDEDRKDNQGKLTNEEESA